MIFKMELTNNGAERGHQLCTGQILNSHRHAVRIKPEILLRTSLSLKGLAMEVDNEKAERDTVITES
jgi:hypothetical protein